MTIFNLQSLNKNGIIKMKNDELKACLERVITHAKAHVGSFCTFDEYKQNEQDCINLRHVLINQPDQTSSDLLHDLDWLYINHIKDKGSSLSFRKYHRIRADLVNAPAQDVDVDILTESIVSSMKGYTINDRFLSHTVANIIAKYLVKQGYLGTSKPTTDEKRVMDLMSDALKTCKRYDHGMAGRGEECDIDMVEQALVEYEKLRGAE